MATNESLICVTAPAGADLSASQYCFVDINSDGEAVLQATSGGDAVGVLQNKPKEGEAALIAVVGVTPLKISAGVTAGGYAAATVTTGAARTATSTDRRLARFLETNTNAGAVISALIMRGAAQA